MDEEGLPYPPVQAMPAKPPGIPVMHPDHGKALTKILNRPMPRRAAPRPTTKGRGLVSRQSISIKHKKI